LSNIEPSLREQLTCRVIARAMLPLAEERANLEADLGAFVEAAWPTIDSSEYQSSWAIDALCEHLEAIASGQIKRLLCNYPPRASKTSVASICFPAWVWAQRERTYLTGPQVRFLAGSYNHELSLANSNMTRRLILSPFYQRLWGRRFSLRADMNTKTKYDTSENGSRMAISVGGSLLGIGGDMIIVDDPMNTQEVQSDAERETALQWWRELSTTRLNDPKQSALVVIMQRIHELDVSGEILSSEASGEWTHLCIPAEYEWRRHCVTVLGWQDPRGLDDNGVPLVSVLPGGERVPRDAMASNELDKREGELMWPERFGRTELARIKAELGPYLASGRLQQSPVPAKGGIFLREWWNLWEAKDGKFPPFDYVIASLDSAFTENEQNDPSALTVWGIFRHEGKRRIMLCHAWMKHLAFSSPRIDKDPKESIAAYKARARPSFGLVEWTQDTCERFKVDKLLIEAKASGISAAQELRNRYGFHGWAVQTVSVRGDKLARALAVQPIFSQGLVFAPNRDWAELAITQMSMFPHARHDDVTDSATLALKYLRDCGLAQTDEEAAQVQNDKVVHRGRRAGPLYPGCR
jgi:predicted phage terminase large subunit-like protein